MAVAPTYPGVYIEEIPSGVHTITGVATSITAFVGFTARGNVNKPIQIFSYADFEREFGGLAVDSPLSYAVKQFFQNGGTEAFVVRVAAGAQAATVTLTSNGGDVLVATANGAGTWGHNLRLDVDYDTSNPSSLFNLKVTEFVDQNGKLVPARSEQYRNLSLNSGDGSYAPTVVNASSAMITLAPGTATVAGKGSSTSDKLAPADIAAYGLLNPPRIAVAVNGQGPYQLSLDNTKTTGTTIGSNIAAQINAAIGGANPAVNSTGSTSTKIVINSTLNSDNSSIHFYDAASNNAAKVLHLGLTNGGTEVDGAAGFRPQESGTTGAIVVAATPATATAVIDVKSGSSNTVLRSVTLRDWGAAPLPPVPADVDAMIAELGDAINANANSQNPDPALIGATVRRYNNTVQVLPGPGDPNVSFDFGSSTNLNSLPLGNRNVGHYAPGIGQTAFGQVQGLMGFNGSAPGPGDLTGSQSQKTGLYALEDVDLFNLLVMPDATTDQNMLGVLSEAISYCERRRAFMILDIPATETDFVAARTFMNGSASVLRSRNSALYFPPIKARDPLKNNVLRPFPSAGAVAGIYARTDAERGVWKAPAGLEATVEGALDVNYKLTDGQNGVLNPLGLNCIRLFPLVGPVVWGARTGDGADALADEYKYIPVRRLALFLEETLYRGTQWVVFEPNDEPLWAQIRLNLGAFMHTMYAQGAFAGRTPREAYFVKCDKETTTPNDVDLGRVNIVVGFAPLKPAEFVIIKIQQIVRDLQV